MTTARAKALIDRCAMLPVVGGDIEALMREVKSLRAVREISDAQAVELLDLISACAPTDDLALTAGEKEALQPASARFVGAQQNHIVAEGQVPVELWIRRLGSKWRVELQKAGKRQLAGSFFSVEYDTYEEAVAHAPSWAKLYKLKMKTARKAKATKPRAKKARTQSEAIALVGRAARNMTRAQAVARLVATLTGQRYPRNDH